MRKHALLGALGAVCIAAAAVAAPPYQRSSPSGGTTADGTLDALTDIYNTLKSGLGTATGGTPASSQVSCATTATQVLAADATKAVRTLSNQSGATIYLGGSGVTSSTGLPVPSGAGYDASSLTGALYCVTASGTAVVGTLQY